MHEVPFKAGVPFLIPSYEVKQFATLIKEKGNHIDQFVEFVDEFVEVQLENYAVSELYFNERLTNLFLSQVNEWCDDTGTNPTQIIQLFDEVGKEIALNYLKGV